MNGYWEDKIAKVENIDIPAYVVANYNAFHNGGLEGFRGMRSHNKWLRIENTIEWPDNYEPQNLDDLRRFYDRYLKGIHNGWEFTPRVRITVYDAGSVDVVNRPENEWPLARAQYQELFLDAATGTLSPQPVQQESLVRYKADGTGEATFAIRFDEDTELVGYWKLRLWVEAEGADDMDLFVSVQKLDQQGDPLSIKIYGLPHSGVSGILRISHRELDEARSTPSEPVHTHRRQQLLSLGEIVPVEIDLWPLGMIWHAGQQLRIVVSDHPYVGSGSWATLPAATLYHMELVNRGEHIIHTGGKYDSNLLVPVIPR
jgi:putative CocE/NonD family hydrolase